MYYRVTLLAIFQWVYLLIFPAVHHPHVWGPDVKRDKWALRGQLERDRGAQRPLCLRGGIAHEHLGDCLTFLVLFAVAGAKVKSNTILINHAVTAAVLLCVFLRAAVGKIKTRRETWCAWVRWHYNVSSSLATVFFFLSLVWSYRKDSNTNWSSRFILCFKILPKVEEPMHDFLWNIV